MLAVLAATLATGLATGLGALPFFFARALARRLYDAILGAGAGLMLAAATMGLLETGLRGVELATLPTGAARLALVVGGLAAGLVGLAVLDRLVPHQHAGGHRAHLAGADGHVHAHGPGGLHGHEQDRGPGDAHGHSHGGAASLDGDDYHQALMLLGAMTIHRLPEGFAIGAAYALGDRGHLGPVLALAIAAQNACEGVVMAAPLRQAGLPPARTLALAAATGLALPLGAAVGFALGRGLLGLMPGALGFAAGALLYVAFNEVIPESHSHGNETQATLGLAVGVTVVLALQTFFGH